MNKFVTLTLAVLAVFLTDCRWLGIRGNGHVITDQRNISEFTEIYADGMFTIEWRQGAPALSITTDENLLQYISSTVSDNKLHVHCHEHVLPTRGLKIVVSSSARSGCKLRGASELKASGLSGASFAVETTGAADVGLAGNVDFLVADMTGASDLQASALQCKTAEISTTGAADADVRVSDTLRVTITGAGSVTYHGEPKTIEKHVTGAGEVRRKD